jgi:hypothetical protein
MAGIDVRNPLISAADSGHGRTALYILGGAGESQFLKFQKAASIYKQVDVSTVWVMQVDGITTFDPELSRNLTEDEWTLRELTRAGVPPEAIEFQRIEDRFFGTFSEARTLAVLCHEKRITTLLLVCAGYHARRVEVTFSALLSAGGVKIEIHPTDESVSAIGLLYEYVKKEWYETVLIPFWQRKNRTLPKRENQSVPAERVGRSILTAWMG